MKTRVQKWGNSLALRIPQPFAKETKLEENTTVEITVRSGTLVIEPIIEPALSLDQLVSAITESNRHDEVRTGDSSGNEAW